MPLPSITEAKILIVDDNIANIALLEAILEEEDYQHVVTTTDPRQVLDLYRQHQFDLVLLDIRMPWLSGFDVLELLKNEVGEDYVPVIVLTAQTDMETRQQALKGGAKDFLTKPFQSWEVLLRIRNCLETRLYYTRQVVRAETLEKEVQLRTEEIRQTQLEIVRRLGVAGEFRDNETGAHVERMSHFSSLLAQLSGQSSEYVRMLFYASTMHDVGKIGIRDSVLLKAGPLTAEERQEINRHPVIGSQIIGDHPSELMTMAWETTRFHHEKWDGSGYPHGLAGEEIPLCARIVAVCDVFDALISERPYKKAWSVEEAVAEIKRQSGSHFEPRLVDQFVTHLERFISIKLRYSDEAFQVLSPQE
nr:HD domain-containing phosphohydrolase [uncultured Desulfuromonas sp.]